MKIRIQIQTSDGKFKKGEVSSDFPESHYNIPVVKVEGVVMGQLDLAINGLVPVAETEKQRIELKRADIQHIYEGKYVESVILSGNSIYKALIGRHE